MPVSRPRSAPRRTPRRTRPAVATPRGRLHFAPLTAERWGDFETLFGANGACGGCWCLWWKLSRPEFNAGKGAGNQRAQRARVTAGEEPGILAYAGDTPVAWCALEPRAGYPRLANSRNLQPVDSEPVWSVTCFFVHRSARRRGLTVQLLEAAKRHARQRGGRILEGYPIESGDGNVPAAFAYTGFVAAFRAAGFVEVARRSQRQPVMRCTLRATRASRPRATGGRNAAVRSARRTGARSRR
jgi:GNAT superfamily N-acetyltransferase